MSPPLTQAKGSSILDYEEDEEDSFTVCIPTYFPHNGIPPGGGGPEGKAGVTETSPGGVPKLFLQASKSLPHPLHTLSTIKPYEPPKSEKLRHRPELLRVEFTNDDGALDESKPRDQGEGESPESASPQQVKSPSKKNLKFKQLLARFQSSISPRTASEATTSDDPLEWLEGADTHSKGPLKVRTPYHPTPLARQ